MLGKLLGAGLGFAAIGGPGGILVGFMTGHALDVLRTDVGLYRPRKAVTPDARAGSQQGAAGSTTRHQAKPESRKKQQPKEEPWINDLTRLAAKVAKSDGQVSSEEIRVFKQAPFVQKARPRDIADIFNQAKTSARGVDAPALRLTKSLGQGSQQTMAALDVLVAVAWADGRVGAQTRQTLQVIAACLGHTSEQLDSLILRRQPPHRRSHGPSLQEDYDLLGVRAEIDEKSLKSAYRRLARDLHPDAMIARGVSEEQRAEAEEKLARVNAAYERILAARGWK